VENEIHNDNEDVGSQPSRESLNGPLLIIVVALLVSFGFQTFQLARERANLSEVKSRQDGAIQEAEKIRVQFESLISNTSTLAEKGHAGARMVVEELQRRGVGVQIESRPPSTDLKGK
jgi:hypothetical protein